MTALDGDLIGDEAVTAAAEAIEDEAIRRIGRDLGTVHRDDIVRAGLAAALPWLADALRASQPDRGTSDGAPGGGSRVSVALSGLQGHSAPTSSPTEPGGASDGR